MEAQQTQSVQQGIKKEGFHITVTQMCITAVFMALTCVATMVVQIPIPLGYAHLGDSVILICAFFFGPVVSVKGIVGAVVTLLFMTLGYVVFGAIIAGSFAAGLASAPGLLLKSVVNMVVYLFVATGMSKILGRNNN